MRSSTSARYACSAAIRSRLEPIHRQQVFGTIAENALFVRAKPGGFRYTLAADALTDELGEEDIQLADKGYESNAIRAKAAERKAWATLVLSAAEPRGALLQ